MKALSVRAPWWYAILHLGKPIENRDWYTNVRGTVYLHASKWFRPEDVRDIWHWDVKQMFQAANPGQPVQAWTHDLYEEIKAAGGCLVGKVDIVGCVMSYPSPWFVGKHGLVLANPVALAKPIPFKGALGFFEVPDGIEDWDTPGFAEGHEAAPLSKKEDPLFTGLDLSSKGDLAGGRQ